MNKHDLLRNDKKNKAARPAKECAYLAVFVALVIASQVALAVVPGVELVTVMFVAYSFVMGVRRGMTAAVAFAFLRQIVFGIYPTVLVLYLIYFPLLALCFGALGKKIKRPVAYLVPLVAAACVCTACFTMIDNVLTPLWYGYSARSVRLYFMASLPFMLPQLVCTAASTACLFLPLYKVFCTIKRTM